jgi:hypothetical protein
MKNGQTTHKGIAKVSPIDPPTPTLTKLCLPNWCVKHNSEHPTKNLQLSPSFDK